MLKKLTGIVMAVILLLSGTIVILGNSDSSGGSVTIINHPSPERRNVNENISLSDFDIQRVTDSDIVGSFTLANRSLEIHSNLWVVTSLELKTDDLDKYVVNSQSNLINLSKYETRSTWFYHPIPENIPEADYELSIEIMDASQDIFIADRRSLSEFSLETNDVDFVTLETIESKDYKDNKPANLKANLISDKPVDVFKKIAVYELSKLANPHPILEKTYTENLSLSPNEEEAFILENPAIENPGIYSMDISLVDKDNNIVSSVVRHNFRVEGDFASVDYTKMDYSQNTSDINITTFVTGKRDYVGLSDNMLIEDVKLSITVSDKDSNQIYSSSKLVDLYPYMRSFENSFKYTGDSEYLTVEISLTKDDVLLDEYTQKHTVDVLKETPDESKLDEIVVESGLLDVENSQYEEAVNKLVDLEVVTGYPDRTFKADNSITRAEFVTMAYNLISLNKEIHPQGERRSFEDVQVNHWAYDFISSGVEFGLLSGYPDDKFRPQNNISYPEAFTICVRMILDEEELDDLKQWPLDFLIKASELGLDEGISTRDIRDEKNATRGDVANMLARVYEIWE